MFYHDMEEQAATFRQAFSEATDAEVDSITGEHSARAKDNLEELLYLTEFAHNLPDAVIVMDMSYRILGWNETAEALFGWEKEEVIGKLAFDILQTTFPYNPRGRAECQEVLASKGRWQGEVIQQHRDGEKLNILISLSLVRDRRGETLGLLAMQRDITERRRAEEQAHLLYSEAQQARDQLMAYLTEHKEVERRKDEFMSVVSHELKTPVTTIKGFVQLLQRRLKNYDDPDAQLFLSRLDSQLNRLTRLINDLLEISRIQTGRLKYHNETFDLREVVESVVEQIQATTTTHRLSFEDMTQTPALVSGDRERLGHVFTNLLMNAIKYSPHADSIIIRVTVDEQEVIVSVQDSGIGIAESDLEKIFERFYQVSYPQERPFSGLGIGLYLSHEIITRHNGQIRVESQKEHGSTFYVALPLVNL